MSATARRRTRQGRILGRPTATTHMPLITAALAGIAMPFAPANAQDVANAVDGYVSRYVDAGDFGGCVLIARGDDVLLERCWGPADRASGKENTLETKFQIGSLSKQMTAVAILRLADRGMLDVDDPISRHLPAYPRGDEITIHHLLTHTAGIPNTFVLPGYDDVKRSPLALAKLVAMFRDQPLTSEPGEVHQYSNSGYVLLAYILETVSGLPYGELMAREIFSPLGMEGSGHDITTATGAIARGYDPAGLTGVEEAPFVHPQSATGAGSLYSTTHDLQRWARALLDGALLSDSSMAKLTRPHAGTYGYGLAIYEPFGRRVLAHDGRVSGFSSDLSMYSDEDVTVLVLSNVQTGIGDAFRRDLAAIVLGEAYELPDLTRTPPVAPVELSELAGTYEFAPSFHVHTRLVDDRLFAAANQGEYTELAPSAGGDFVSRTTYATARFERADDGAISAMIWMQDGNEFRGARVAEPVIDP